jgi:hypothetical protein
LTNIEDREPTMMKTWISLPGWLLVMLSVVTQAVSAAAGSSPTTYYISQSEGDDARDGQMLKADGTHGPWKTLAKASTVTFQPGDQLLLKSGDTWNETLTLHGNGTADQPITLASYGAGLRPLIQGSGEDYSACVIVDRASHYCIRDIEMQSAQHAIRIVVDSQVTTTPTGYLIENCLMRDIVGPKFPDSKNPEVYTHQGLRDLGWAIFIDGFASPHAVCVKQLTVRHCFGLRTQAFFIQMGPVSLEDVLFDGTTVAHSSFNSVYQSSARNFDITNCVFVYGYPWEYHPNGATQVLAGGLTGDATVRNEVVHNEFGWAGDYPGCPDGCAYDFEGSTSGVTFQRNFIHDTFGESVLFMPNCAQKDILFDGNIFRNNVRFSPRWDMEVTLFPNNTGNGTFSDNVFFARPGKRIINSQPACFTFTGNTDQASGTFVEMPLVTEVAYGDGMRTFTLMSKTPGATIRYTMDGSLPSASSAIYTAPLAVLRSGALNAKAFKDGCYDSYVNCVPVDLRSREGQHPVAWWKLDEASGDTAADSAGGRTGALQHCTWAQGDSGPGLDFDGARSAVAINGGDLRAISDTFSIALWARPRAERSSTPESSNSTVGVTGQRYALFPHHLGGGGDAGVGLSIGTNGVSVLEHATDYLPALLVDDCVLSGWNHIVVVYRNKQPTLYVNGVYEKAGCQSTKVVRPAFDLGGSDYGWYDGTLSDIRVFDRALTDAEIQVLAARRG